MAHELRARSIRLNGDCYLILEPDTARPQRYLVRFCGLNSDRAAIAATEPARVQLMLANLRGQAPYPYPLPARVTIGWLDAQGWHLGRSPYAKPLAEMAAVRSCIQELLDDLLLRVALIASEGSNETPD